MTKSRGWFCASRFLPIIRTFGRIEQMTDAHDGLAFGINSTRHFLFESNYDKDKFKNEYGGTLDSNIIADFLEILSHVWNKKLFEVGL